jgi:hypothetical protein
MIVPEWSFYFAVMVFAGNTGKQSSFSVKTYSLLPEQLCFCYHASVERSQRFQTNP